MGERVVIAAYDPEWPDRFRQIARRLREGLGDEAMRIDHIGSTAVSGLDAKPIIDIQVSVPALDPVDAFRKPLEELGYVWRADNPDRTKRCFREAPGDARTHVHVRRADGWPEQAALLFRDYLRAHPGDADRYGATKRTLATQYADDRRGYTDAKGDIVWSILRSADRWSQEIGWSPGASDA